ncbi:hypothetical protein EV424DRAFT_1400631 [Suillus variegatus]|nr:hypothetical protein EV424DRAFT_1400631 [Suillus variegatus]
MNFCVLPLVANLLSALQVPCSQRAINRTCDDPLSIGQVYCVGDRFAIMSDEYNFEGGCGSRSDSGVGLIAEWGATWACDDEMGVGKYVAITHRCFIGTLWMK